MQTSKILKILVAFLIIASLAACNSSKNSAPVADSQSVTMDEDRKQSILLKGFDVDEYDEIDFIITQRPKHGELIGKPPGMLYAPFKNYYGSDSFKFKVTDGKTESAEASVDITINSVNDTPTAYQQNQTMDTNKNLGIVLTGSDIENDSNLSFIITESPKHGTLAGNAPNLLYTPDINYYGFDSFRFKVNDGIDDSEEAIVRVTIHERPFRIKINTNEINGSTSNKQFAVPTYGDGYNYRIDCNDDGIDEKAGATGESIYICDYNEPGEYIIAIRGVFPQIFENNASASNDSVKIISVEEWGTQRWRSFNSAFMGCVNIMAINASDKPNLTAVTDMSNMFHNTPNLSEQDFSDWNVGNITNHADFCTDWGSNNVPPDGWDCP
jgi:hypothetical protein